MPSTIRSFANACSLLLVLVLPLTGAAATSVRRRSVSPPSFGGTQSATKVVSAVNGGVISVGGAVVRFAPYTFPSDHEVTVVVRPPNVDEQSAYTDAVAILGADVSANQLLVIDTDYERPLSDISVTLPAGPRASGSTPVLFVEHHWDGDAEATDSFEPFESTTTGGSVTTMISAETFTDLRSDFGTFDCAIIAGSLPTTSLHAETSASCPNVVFSSPFAAQGVHDLTIIDGFGNRILNGRPEFHDGVDLRVPSDPTVQPAAAGCIDRVGFSQTYGQIVIMSHGNGSAYTVYGHLEAGSVAAAGKAGIDYPVALLHGGSVYQKPKTPICIGPGTVIGRADSTGAHITGPHLHFEVSPRPIDFTKKHGRVDPEVCAFGEPVLSVSTAGSGKGTVQIAIDGRKGRVACGTGCSQPLQKGNATLIAVPDPPSGSEFGGWSGVSCGTDLSCPITISTDTSVVASFDNPTCSTQQFEGGDIPETRFIDMGRTSGTFDFSYETYVIPDRIVVSYEGRALFDTGCVGAGDSTSLSYSGTSTLIRVEVQPNCEGDTGTAWDFTVSCPR